MTASINGTTGVTFPDASVQATAATSGLVNKIINGRMEIDQRNAGASVTPNSTYTLDRWQLYNSQTSKLTVQQNAGSVTPPVGFKNYLGVTSSSSYSVISSDYFVLSQAIEGFNVADLSWGTSSAKAVTLSFQVYSSLTGTFGGALRNLAATRSYPFTYTISSANTWTTVSVTVAGCTDGVWATDNTTGLYVFFGLGVGSTLSGTAGSWASTNYNSATGATSVVGTNGATFYITGVDLRKGSVAPSTYNMDWRPYGLELALCQRYYEFGISGSVVYNANQFNSAQFKATKRAAPTVSISPASGTMAFITTDACGFYAQCSATAGATWTATSEL